MRYIFVFLSFFVFFSSYSQDKNIDIVLKNTPLKKALRQLEKDYNLHFSYNSSIVQEIEITVSIKKSSLDEALRELLLETGIKHEVVKGKYVVLTKSDQNENLELFDLCGELVDSLTNLPLPFANVQIKESGTGATSDENGRFIYTGKYSSDDILQVFYLGYESIEIPVKFFINNPCASIGIKKKANIIDEIVVTEYITDGVDMVEELPYVKIEPKKLGALAGSSEPDVLNTLQILPGINSPDGKSSSLNIRGGTPDQNLILWDNIPIYYGGHFFGMVSPFNPYVVDNIKVYRSGFDARYGGRVSGTLDIQSISSIPDSLMGGVGINLLHGDGFVVVPVKEIKSALVIGGRKSFFNTWKSPTFYSLSNVVFQDTKVAYSSSDSNVVNKAFAMDYTDYMIKLIMEPTETDKIYLSYLVAKNQMSYSFQDTSIALSSVDYFSLKNYGYSAFWDRNWNDKLNTNLSFIYSDYRYNAYDTLSEINTNVVLSNNDNSNELTDYQLMLTNTISFSPKHRIEAGLGLKSRELTYKYFENYSFEPDISGSIKSILNTGSLFADYTFSNKKRVLLRPGFRYTYYKELNRNIFEPRFYGQYKLSGNFQLKGSIGVYYQDLSQLVEVGFNKLGAGNDLWVLADGNNIEIIESKQIMIGGIYNFRGWKLDVEGYYKTLKDITTFSNSLAQIINQPFEYGNATIYGFDVFFKKRWNQYRAWFSYSLSQTEYLFPTVSSVAFPAPHDQRHKFSLGQVYSWKQFELSLSWNIATGRPYNVSDSVVGEYIPSYNDTGYYLAWQPNNVLRLPLFHQLDFSLVYNFPKKDNHEWRGKLGISLINIYNRRNVLSKEYFIYEDLDNPGLPQNHGFHIGSYELYRQGFTPNLLLRLEF